MAAYIYHIATATPRYAYGQAYTRDRIKGLTADPRVCRLIHAIYNRSGIETRHSVCDDFIEGVEPSLYKTNAAGALVSPTTAERNRRCQR